MGDSGILHFFGLFGLVFLVTQYFQLVRGYGAFEAGWRTMPFALFTGISAPLAPHLARRIGCGPVVAIGLALMGLSSALIAGDGAATPYGTIVIQMLPLGLGLGLVNATGTDTILLGLPPAQAGVGSAVNDTARELGGTLGVAAMGSLFASLYSGTVGRELAEVPLPAGMLALCQGSVAAASEAARRVAADLGPEAAGVIRSCMVRGFLDGFGAACRLGAAFLVAGSFACAWILPRRRAVGTAAPSAPR